MTVPNFSSVRALIFDLDGTLIDSKLDLIRSVNGGNSFGTKKPDPLGAQTILREFGAAPAEAVLIGDSEVDVQTARNAGTLAAAVNYGFGTHDRAAYPADTYLDRLADLVPLLMNGRQ